MRYERTRRPNGNLYPLTFQDRRRRGSFKEHAEEFPGIERRGIEQDSVALEVTRLSNEILEKLARPRTTWERIKEWVRVNLGGYPGGDRLL